MDPDLGAEDAAAGQPADEVAGAGDDERRDEHADDVAWTKRRNGRSKRKKPMSLPKIGSTTGLAPAGANGTRFSQRRIVCQSPAIEPAIVSATRTATTAMIPRPERGRVRHVAGRDVDGRAAAGVSGSPTAHPARPARPGFAPRPR